MTFFSASDVSIFKRCLHGTLYTYAIRNEPEGISSKLLKYQQIK